MLLVALAEKFPEAQEKEILKVIGNLVYYKFINPAVIAPDKYTTYKLLLLCASRSAAFSFFMAGSRFRPVLRIRIRDPVPF